MIYEGKKVCHNKFGVGIITKQQDDRIVIKFDKNHEERIFAFPRCFEKHVQVLDDKIHLLSVLENHGFEGFHHYTDFKNFLKIMEAGKLYSRTEAEENGVLIKDAAQKTIIARTTQFVKDRVRFYYKEDTPTLCRNIGIRHTDDFDKDDYDAHMPIPVLLLFEKELLFEPDVCVSSGGCGSFLTRTTSDFKEALSYDWDETFRREPIRNVTDAERKVIINKRNAEFLFPKAVKIERLKSIVFRCEADKKHAEFILGANDLYQVEPNKFHAQYFQNRKRNYLKDYRVRIDGARREIELEFFKSPVGYNHIIKQYFQDGRVEAINIGHFCLDNCLIGFTYDTKDDSEKIEYLLNNEVSAIWR